MATNEEILRLLHGVMPADGPEKRCAPVGGTKLDPSEVGDFGAKLAPCVAVPIEGPALRSMASRFLGDQGDRADGS